MSAEAVEQEVTHGGWSGDQLRIARHRMGLTAEQVERQLFFQPGYVDALEEGNFKRLPGAIFVKGYIRAYAKLLHVSPNLLLQEFQERTSHHAPSLEVEAKPAPASHAVWDQKTVRTKEGINWRLWVVITLVMVLLLAMWWPQLSPAINRWLLPFNLSLPAMHVQQIVESNLAEDSSGLSRNADLVTANDELVDSKVLDDLGGLTASLHEGGSVATEVPTIEVPAHVVEDSSVEEADGAADDDKSAAADKVAASILEDGRWQIGAHDLNAAEPDRLQVKFRSSTWLQISDAKGVSQPLKSYAKNTEINIKGIAPFSLIAGDIKAVDIQFNKREVDL